MQTIHGFCTRLLQQFPFEANVPARFRVLEEVEQQQLLEQLRRTMLFEASSNPDSADRPRADRDHPGRVGLRLLRKDCCEAIRERERLLAWVEHAGGIEQAAAQLSVALGIKPDDTLEAIEAAIVDGPHLPSSGWMSAAGVCASGSTNDQDQARRLQDAIAATGRTRVDAYLEDLLHRRRRAARARRHQRRLRKKYPDLAQQLVERERSASPRSASSARPS